MEVRCERCNHEWTYSGNSEYYATCPNCKTSVSLDTEPTYGEPGCGLVNFGEGEMLTHAEFDIKEHPEGGWIELRVVATEIDAYTPYMETTFLNPEEAIEFAEEFKAAAKQL